MSQNEDARPRGGDDQPQQEPVGNPDVQYCPHCGDPISSHQRHWYDDLVLNRYRTEFECPGCGYHGEVFRHSPGERDPKTMTDGGRPEHGVFQDDLPDDDTPSGFDAEEVIARWDDDE